MRRVLSLAVLVAAGGCKTHDKAEPALDPGKLHDQLLVIDSHLDVPYRILKDGVEISKRLPDGHFDFPRAREGGLDAPFFAVYVASTYDGIGSPENGAGGRAWEESQRIIGKVQEVLARNRDVAALARSPDELLDVVHSGKIAVALGLENGSPLVGDPSRLGKLWDEGIRYVTLTHAADNGICDSSFDNRHTNRGLSAFGETLVGEMNRMGMMIDVSHASDEAFWRVMALTQSPVIASHSGARAVCASERNLTDDMLRAIKENGGVVQIPFGSYFLRDDAREALGKLHEEINHIRAAVPDEKEADRRVAQVRRGYSMPHASVEDVVRHIDHVVQTIGVEHVGIGSDFDGVVAVPEGLEDVTGYPHLTEALLRHGYTPEQIALIAGGNLMRVWRENLARAAKSSDAKRARAEQR